MNNIDMILQNADLPESPVDAISDERQAKILSGALQLARQDAKKRSRRRVVRIAAAAAAAASEILPSCTAFISSRMESPPGQGISRVEPFFTPRAWSSVQTVRQIRIPMIFLMTRSSASTRRGGRQAPTAA